MMSVSVVTPKKITARLVYASLAPDVSFDDDGIELAPLWSKPIRIGWNEIEFVCVVPEMTHGPHGWQVAPNPYRSGPSMFETSGQFDLEIVVRDRRPILARTEGRLTRLWLATRLRPMLDEHDRRQPDESLLDLTLRRDRLQGTVDELLDFVAARSRVDLVAFG
jgi:hypothetical protein